VQSSSSGASKRPAKLQKATAALQAESSASKRPAAATPTPAAAPPTSCLEWFSVEQLEAISGISKWTWRRWCQIGKVASAKVSTRLLISRAEYERTMDEATRPRNESQEKVG
jgi:hypothetical protein